MIAILRSYINRDIRERFFLLLRVKKCAKICFSKVKLVFLRQKCNNSKSAELYMTLYEELMG